MLFLNLENHGLVQFLMSVPFYASIFLCFTLFRYTKSIYAATGFNIPTEAVLGKVKLQSLQKKFKVANR